MGVAVSGCRLNDGRLHLGHYLGCFHPTKSHLVTEIFFVIQDTETNTVAGIPPAEAPLALILSQLYSLPIDARVIPCLQSAIFPVYSPLYDYARASLTARALETVHPKKDDLRAPANLVLRNYLFPIDQAVQFLAFGAEAIFMNDDNVRFVRLAKRLYRKLPTSKKARIPCPRLITKPAPRLLGSDGMKMAKAQNNCIFLLDDEHTIIEQIKNYARGVGWRWTQNADWRFEGTDIAKDLTTGSALMSLVPSFTDWDESRKMTVADGPQIVEQALKTILPLAKGIRSNVEQLLMARPSLVERLQQDTAYVINRIESALEAFD